MTPLSPNFYLEEFHCRDGSKVPAHLMPNIRELVANLQILRNEIREPIHINSGYRTASYNKKIGGAPRSQHLKGKAADIVTQSYTPKQLAAVIERLITGLKMKQGGIGIYPSFVHYDVRGYKSRW